MSLQQRINDPDRRAAIQRAVGQTIRIRIKRDTVWVGTITAVEEIIKGRRTTFKTTVRYPNGSLHTINLENIPLAPPGNAK